VNLEVSLGDFVLTGGELPALALADAMIRQLEGALGPREAHTTESFSLMHPRRAGRLLEYPHYTRPAEFRGRRVPEILLSGDHGKIDRWRLDQAENRTLRVRPDLLPGQN
jgi:tRNA (guanine37-N1)-methyltransferase